jgi:Sec-independent protein translocase protein TatA
MDLMGVGSAEVLMIILVALLVVGPRKVVDLARTMGKISRTIKKASLDFTSSVTREIDLENKPQTTADKPQISSDKPKDVPGDKKKV